jgi:hypothetical protein
MARCAVRAACCAVARLRSAVVTCSLARRSESAAFAVVFASAARAERTWSIAPAICSCRLAPVEAACPACPSASDIALTAAITGTIANAATPIAAPAANATAPSAPIAPAAAAAAGTIAGPSAIPAAIRPWKPPPVMDASPPSAASCAVAAPVSASTWMVGDSAATRSASAVTFDSSAAAAAVSTLTCTFGDSAPRRSSSSRIRSSWATASASSMSTPTFLLDRSASSARSAAILMSASDESAVIFASGSDFSAASTRFLNVSANLPPDSSPAFAAFACASREPLSMPSETLRPIRSASALPAAAPRSSPTLLAWLRVCATTRFQKSSARGLTSTNTSPMDAPSPATAHPASGSTQ